MMAHKTMNKKQKIIRALNKGKAVREIVRELGVTSAYVYKIRADMLESQGIQSLTSSKPDKFMTQAGIPTVQDKPVQPEGESKTLSIWQRIVKLLKGEF